MKVELIGSDFKLNPVSRNKDITRYELDFGIVKQGDGANFDVVVTSNNDILDFNSRPSCGGCTTVKQKRLSDKQYKVITQYDSRILGKINKSVNINYTDKDGNKNIQIKMAGTIIR